MRAVTIRFTPELLREFDADEVVVKEGRSAVLRRLVEEYLHRQEQRRMDEAYARGYGPDFPPIEEELAGWSEAAVPFPDA